MNTVESAQLALSDADPRKRADGLRMLGARGGPACIAEILRMRGDRDPFVRGTVCEALGGVAEDVEPGMLLPTIADTDPRTRSLAVRALEQCGLRGVAAALIPLLDDPDPMVRSQVAQTLGAWQYSDALPAIEERLHLERSAEVRPFLYYARLRLPDAVQAWSQLDTEPWETLRCTLRCISHTGLHGGAGLLARCLQSPHAGPRQSAAAALVWSDLPDPDLLLACTQDAEPVVCAGVIAALFDRADERLLHLARSMLVRPVHGFGTPAIRYLGQHGSDDDCGLLDRLCESPPSEERDAAQRALALIRGTATANESEPFPDGEAAAVVAGQLADSVRVEERMRAGIIRIANGLVSPGETLGILDRARARFDFDTVGVLVAMLLADHPEHAAAMRCERALEPTTSWVELGQAIAKSGLRWIGPVAGRLTQPLHAGGFISPATLLMRLADSRSPRAPVQQGCNLSATRVWQAAEQAQSRLVVDAVSARLIGD